MTEHVSATLVDRDTLLVDGVPFDRRSAELDAAPMGGKSIFGGGLLLSERAAAERAAVIRWPLSEREREMVRMISKRGAGK